jgi:hypothetical protein
MEAKRALEIERYARLMKGWRPDEAEDRANKNKIRADEVGNVCYRLRRGWGEDEGESDIFLKLLVWGPWGYF